ncbi:helix-turn-helix domain-containing protein [Pollutimonas thiosulfatoxidans]|nr:AraC family transcriptional regulator [Pollutimonas thiosulfatoxidans]MBF6615860.1 helix-turn-helix transcriptional regulator [Candidimonas sp.]NYT44831.1 helix-turn-helix transcriptional regulator [Alcaligenaceae bacterium]
MMKQMLVTDLSNPPQLGELADKLQTSKKRLSRALRLGTGMTLPQYLREERMRRAQRLLTQTSLPVAVIAREVGFSSVANFSHAFRQQVGMPPSAFRKQSPLEALTSIEGALQWAPERDGV